MGETPSRTAAAADNPFQLAQAQLDRAARLLELQDDVHAILREPERELHVALPVRMDDGSVRVFPAFRVQHNSTRGPHKGGIRFHPDETIDTIRALAMWMTWKTAMSDLPLGGGKGGVICNPRAMSVGELERLSRSYIRHIWPVIGPDRDVPAPDVYTTPQVMAWMADEYARMQGRYRPGVITGKPLDLGGSLGRDEATGRGGVYAVREAARYLDLDLTGARVAIQGFGNAGSFAARRMVELTRTRVVAVSDSSGGIYNERGLDPEAVAHFKGKTGSVEDFPDSESITNAELLELDVEVLLPSALENVITSHNASRIKARVVGELANGPTTIEADDVLRDRGVFVIPDLLCNAGGVIVSYFELVQNLNFDRWSLGKVFERLEERICDAFGRMIAAYEAHDGIDPRMAAYVVAVDRVARTMARRGLPL